MTERRVITGDSAEEIWPQINADFIAGNGLHDYHVVVQQDGTPVDLDIVSSPGGNDEGGYEYTRLSAPITVNNGFKFEIFPEDIINKVGKLFGLQDLKLGYPEFDENVIVQSNDEEFLKKIFADADVREIFQSMSGFSLKTVNDGAEEGAHLELNIQRSVLDAGVLHDIFNAFCHVLSFLRTA